MGQPCSLSTYAAGVNLELGDAAARLLYPAAQRTWEQRADRIGEVTTQPGLAYDISET